MTRRRWIADEVSGDTAALLGGNAVHLARVLRAKVGQQFDLSLGDRVRQGTITSVEDERVTFALGDEIAAAESDPIHLYLAVFKFDRFEWAVEKCTELGVARIVPVISQRTEPHLAKASLKRAERWRKIAVEAAQQSRRISAPEVGDPLKLKAALTQVEGARIVLAESEREHDLREVLGEQSSRMVSLAVGPEGGWSEDEVAQFAAAGWKSASLGETILRAETAGIAATAIAAHLLR